MPAIKNLLHLRRTIVSSSFARTFEVKTFSVIFDLLYLESELFRKISEAVNTIVFCLTYELRQGFDGKINLHSFIEKFASKEFRKIFVKQSFHKRSNFAVYCDICVSVDVVFKSSFDNRQMMLRNRFVSFSHFRDVAVSAFQERFCVAIEHIYADEVESFLLR